jgi:phage terminase small subunit
MPRGGANRKTDKARLLAGTHRKDRHGDPADRPQLDDGMPEPPATLGDTARKEWFAVCADLKKAGLLKRAYRAVLIGYCELYGRLYDSPAAFKTAEHTQMRQYINALGLSPQAISGLRGAGGDVGPVGGDADDFGDLDE